MPRGLAIETSGRLGSIAVIDGDAVVAEEVFPHGLKHAAEIVPIIDRLTRSRGWSPRDVEHLYVSAGPGSFTGLRIGVTLAKVMALATGVKLVAAPSLQVLARNAPADAQHLIVVLDAKRDQIFTARFERAGSQWLEREPAKLDDLTSMLARSPRPVHLLGEGIPYHQQFIPPDDGSVIVTPPERWRARASAVAEIGATFAAAGEFNDPFTLTPIYVRRPEAEEKYELAQKNRA
ncbi:MAG TPA: tRNA (adenosine(37)-N6)-threonylcarbamoyltransferase complex dimerization subunit type 1 TsaB [Tepidisphaeraceae bacterium]|nr:tRNA (adenosine(37)-N6)-threonylcarbamoyltransferase complex dimerization subunit type 1 TsaB [Tepidisphaeraceae bacterium]